MMTSMDKVRAAVTVYYDTEIRPTLPEAKGGFLGMMLGVMMAKPDRWLGKVLPIAEAMGAIDEKGNVDVELLAREAKKNLFNKDGVFEIRKSFNPFNPADIDVFRFRPADVDKLVDIIART